MAGTYYGYIVIFYEKLDNYMNYMYMYTSYGNI